MHAVLITFRSAVSAEEMAEGNRQFAEALRNGAAPGFVSKTWLSDGATIGGFYLFEDRRVADLYLNGMFAEAVGKDPAFSDIRIERYEVDETFSAMTNGLAAMAVSGRG